MTAGQRRDHSPDFRSRHQRLVAQQPAQAINLVRRPGREIGKGALNDTAAFTKKNGRARVAIGDGFDVHERRHSLRHGNVLHTWIDGNQAYI